MPRVVTVLCHGTNFHRYETGELVAEFGRCLAGKEIKAAGIGTNADPGLTGDFIINEGPGSKSGKPDAATPGTVNPLLEVKKGLIAQNVESEFARHVYGEGLPSNWAVTGSATGAGWDDNVHKTVGRIANLEQSPEVVNLLGWSRGGITCLKIANKLAEVFPDIKVNIFAVDPVYGGPKGGVVDDVKNVPETVQELWVILSMHERRKTFKPQAESMLVINHSETESFFLPMPGGHDQQVELKRGGVAAEVTWHLAYERLKQWGTRFSKAPITALSDAEVCRKYAQLSLQLDQYKSEGTTGVSNWLVGAGFADRNLPRDPRLPSGYFLNVHHWRCFQTQFPIASKFFLSSGDFAILVKAVQQELRTEDLIRNSIEAYYAALEKPQKGRPQPAV